MDPFSSSSMTAVQQQQRDPPHPTSSPPVVVLVPQGRMITRSLLRSASSLLLNDGEKNQLLRSSPTSLSSATAGERRKRPRAVLVPTTTPSLLPPPVEGNASGPQPSSLPQAHGSVADSPATATVVTDRASASAGLPSPSQRVVIGGLLRCVCNAFLVSPSETLLECSRCRNWCHPACVGVDVGDVRVLQRHRSFVCPFCAPPGKTGEAGVQQQQQQQPSSPSPPPSASPSVSTDASAKTYVEDLSAAPLPQQHASSFTTILGESIPVVCSPSSPGPPPLSSTFTGSLAITTNSNDNDEGNGEHCLESSAESPIIAGVATASPASSAFPLASRQPPTPRQLPQKLRDVPDESPPPALAAHLASLLHTLERTASELGYTTLHLPTYQLTDAQVSESLACCSDAIREATFSPAYPAYCLNEVQQHRHPYVQGTALKSRQDGIICSFVLSNGRDYYGNMRSTITQLKSALHRGFLHPTDVSDFMAHCMTISDVSDFVHITLSATHARYQRKGLARLLMAMELLKWALRGRTRAFLNMAIEKHLVDGGTRIEFASPAASRHLYESFGFADVFPRYDAVTGKERWTAKEADSGRVMANVCFVDDVQRVAAALPAKHSLSSTRASQSSQEA
jgi:GNAT superfamily N-acetyltransferase